MNFHLCNRVRTYKNFDARAVFDCEKNMQYLTEIMDIYKIILNLYERSIGHSDCVFIQPARDHFSI